MTDALVINGVTQGGRRLFSTDAVQAQIVAGTWRRPAAGDTVTLPDGSSHAWTALHVDKDGTFTSDALDSGAYVSIRVDSESDRVALLQARGDSLVYVNGELRAGDPYSYGYLRLPVKLHRGANDLLFFCGRGSLQATLLPVGASPVLLNTDDPTLPDVLTGETTPQWGAVVIINASDAPLTGLHLAATVTAKDGDKSSSGRVTDTALPAIPPMTIRKVGFRLAAPEGMPATMSAVRVGLELMPGGKGSALASGEVAVRVRRPDQSYRRTFVSDVDGSVQYYAVGPAQKPSPDNALILTLHGASVEAIGQVDAYALKDWATLVAPTNRRPYGFDWEEWGRLDALEVLAIAKKTVAHDPARVVLTGHSMGGHGSWSLGSLYPDQFAAVGPSAGWISFATYVNGPAKPATNTPPATVSLLGRGTNISDTLLRTENLLALPVYIVHGDADDNVPVEQERMMRAKLIALNHPNLQWHEQPGAGHWWDLPGTPGADCVDWAPMMDLFQRSRIASPDHIAFTTPSPAVSASCFWLRIEQQEHSLLPSSAHLTYDSATATVRGATENIARLTLLPADLPASRLSTAASAIRTVSIDGQTISFPAANTTAPVYLEKSSGRWNLSQSAVPAGEKNPDRAGPFPQAFQHRFVLVYGTHGTPEENAWSVHRARYDAETFTYRGNGTPETIPDSAYSAREYRNRSVILYGNADTNSAWNALLGKSPIQLHRDSVQIGATVRKGDDLACLFLRPLPGRDRALVGVVGGTGLVGLHLTDRIPYFSSGVAHADWVIADSSVLKDFAHGLVGVGYFGNDWRVESGDSAWAGAGQ